MEGLRMKNYIAYSKEDDIDVLQILRITGGNDKQGFPMKQGVVCSTPP